MRPAIEALLAGATIDGVARDDMIAGLQVPYILPDLLDDARRLMPHHGRNGEMGHCTLFEMQIAVTHAARRGPDKNLIIGGLVDLDRLDRNITALFAEHRSAGDRKSVVEGKSVSVRLDPGGRRIIKKKKKKKN